jgi:hypothetical protein
MDLGFGSATILTPFVAMVIDIKAAIVLVAFFHFANNLSKFTILRKNIHLRLVFVYGLPSGRIFRPLLGQNWWWMPPFIGSLILLCLGMTGIYNWYSRRL